MTLAVITQQGQDSLCKCDRAACNPLTTGIHPQPAEQSYHPVSTLPKVATTLMRFFPFLSLETTLGQVEEAGSSVHILKTKALEPKDQP